MAVLLADRSSAAAFFLIGDWPISLKSAQLYYGLPSPIP